MQKELGRCQRTHSALECKGYVLSGEVVKTAECGMLLKFVERHSQKEFGDALVGKGIGHDIHSFEVEAHLLTTLNERPKLFFDPFAQLTRAKVFAIFSESKCFHNSLIYFVSPQIVKFRCVDECVIKF